MVLPRRILALRPLIALLTVFMARGLTAGRSEGRPDAASVLARASEQGLAELERRSASERPAFDPAHLMKFNLSTYFTAYPTLEGAGEHERLVSALERIVAGFGRGLLEEAGRRAVASGRTAIDAAVTTAVVRDRMRAERTPFDTLVFFSHRRDALPIYIY